MSFTKEKIANIWGLGHLLRISLTEAMKLRLIVIVSTLKIFPQIIYEPR